MELNKHCSVDSFFVFKTLYNYLNEVDKDDYFYYVPEIPHQQLHCIFVPIITSAFKSICII